MNALAGVVADRDVLRVTDLCKSFGGFNALDTVCFSVTRGDILALVGDNGAGKSTLVSALSGAQQPDSGTGDEIIAMNEGWLTASVLRLIDDSGVAVTDSIVAHGKGEPVEEVWGGPFVMIDKDSDAEALVENANRYSKLKMGR